MKRLLSLILAAVLLLSTLSSCSLPHFSFGNGKNNGEETVDTNGENGITKIEWAEMLAVSFGMDECVSTEPYFTDIQATNLAFTYIQSCVEWNVFSDSEKAFNPNELVSLGYVASTAVYAIGADITTYEGETREDKALTFAIANNLVPGNLDYSRNATKEECRSILSTAKFLYLTQEVTPIDNVVINEDVSDQRQTTNIVETGENTYLVSQLTPSVGNVFIAPGTDASPDGVAIKVVSVSDNGDGTYTIETCTPEFHEVFDELEFSGVAIPEFEDIIPASGVTITQTSGGVAPVSYNSNTGHGIVNLSYSQNSNNNCSVQNMTAYNNFGYEVVPLGIGTSKDEALSFTASFNFTKGTVSLSPQWGSQSFAIEQLLTGNNAGTASPGLGEWFEKKSVFPDKTLFGSDAYSNDEAIEAYKKGVINADELREALYGMQNDKGAEKIPNITNKFSGGYEIVGSISIKDLYVVPTYKIKTAKVLGVDTGIPTGIESFSIETNYGASVSLSVKGKLEEELTICSVPVSLGGVGTLTLDLKLYAELNGEISLKASITNNTKAEYKSGKTKKTSAQDSSASVEAELEFEAGPSFSAKLSFCTIPFVNAKISAAVNVKAGCGVELSTQWTETDDAFVVERKTAFTYGVDGHIPIVKLSIGTDKNTLANKLNIKYTWTIVGAEGSKAPVTATKFEILPEEEIILWEDRLEIPKTDEENDDTSNDDSDATSNMGISTYYIYLSVGEEAMVDIEYPAGYDAEDFKWSSTDGNIITVSDGKVKANGAGSASIKVVSSDGKYYANCAVYVGE